MSDALLATKLYKPPLRLAVSRPRLLSLLDEGLAGRLTLISSPAGFGKTTLISQWVRGRDLRTAWLSLDDDDNDATRFLTYLVAAIRVHDPDIGYGAHSLLTSTPRSGVEPVLTSLINDLARVAQPLVIVLDDYHLITTPSIHQAMTYLLDHLPESVHVIVATRADPPLPVARMRGQGVLVELRSMDLRFTPDEVSDFLSSIMRLDLTDEDVDALTDRTEGWITGLQMAAVSLRGRQDVSGLIRRFTGSNRYVLDYLVEEVLGRQPDDVQSFLLRTSVLTRMTAGLCDALMEGDNGERLLQKIEEDNLFVVPLDQERQWYRYHHLFADLLRRRLRHESPDLEKTLLRRAMEWHRCQGDTGDAVDYALAAGEVSRAADLLEADAQRSLMRSEIDHLITHIEELPIDEVNRRPLLSFYYATALLLGGRALKSVEARLAYAKGAEVLPQVTGLLAMMASYTGDVPRAVELATRALELLPEEQVFMRSFVNAVLGLCVMIRGDVIEASRVFQEALVMARQVGNALLSVRAISRLAQLAFVRAKLGQARELCVQGIEDATEPDGDRLPIAAVVLADLAFVHYEWNQLDRAEELLEQAITLGSSLGDHWIMPALIELALVRQEQGDFLGAVSLLERARSGARRFDATNIDDRYVEAYIARLAVARGELGTARAWAETIGLEPAHFTETAAWSFIVDESEHLTLARLLLAEGRHADALAGLAALRPRSEALGRTGFLLEIDGLAAVALDGLGRTEEALATLQEALRVGEPEGYVRTFVEMGRPMAHLLGLVASRQSQASYPRKLLGAFAGQEMPAPTSADDLIEPLSERELDVLRLVAAGLSNKEVADELCISLPTVKWHTRNIYGKFGVNKRIEATIKARALGYID